MLKFKYYGQFEEYRDELTRQLKPGTVEEFDALVEGKKIHVTINKPKKGEKIFSI